LGKSRVRKKTPVNKYSFREYAKELLRHERGYISLKKEAPVRIALVYPNTYEVGMANLGFQSVYRLLNEHPEVRCERAFVEDPEFKLEVRTLESQERLGHFTLIGFSLSFELDLVHIIKCLIRSGIPTLTGDRKEKDPLVILGGAVAGLNPSPLLPFMDGLLVGEGEGIFCKIGDILFVEGEKRSSREKKLQALGEIEGFFIPGLHSSVKRRTVRSLKKYPIYTPIITSKSHFSNMFVVEVSRGCPQKCYFCGAKKIYHPYRSHPVESILDIVKCKNPGANRIGLEGAGLSDYPDLVKLCASLVETGKKLSLSSIRPDRVQPDLLDLMAKGDVRTFTVAPETGSETLREQIGKGMSNSTLRNVVGLLARSKIYMLKLYFLIGLPGETKEDMLAIIHLVSELHAHFINKNRKKRIRISVNAFIPKPFTEFQWAAMATEKELLEKRKIIKRGLKGKKGLDILTKSTRQEILQGVLSLGDESVGLSVLDGVKKGIPWKSALKENGIDVASLIHQERSVDTYFPWDFIEPSFTKNKMWKDYQQYNMNLKKGVVSNGTRG